MQLVKASLIEVNIGLPRDNNEMVGLCTSLEKKYVESETRRVAAETSLLAEQQKSAKLFAVIVVFCVTLLLWVVFPNARVFIGVGGLCFVLGGLLLPEANRLGRYVSEALRQAARLWQSARQEARAVVLRLVQHIRDRIRDWKWKSIPVARIFGTTP